MSKLSYSIYSSSGSSTAFSAENIINDTPFDSRSRWTGAFLSTDKDGTFPVSRENPLGRPPSASGRTTPIINEPHQGQFVTLRLAKPSIVKGIGFGKFHKAHPCNLSKFSVSGGPSPDHMEVLLTGGLQNNAVNERFDLAPRARDVGVIVIPVEYIRIDALGTHAPNYNVTIWHVWLEGIECTAELVTKYDDYRSTRSAHFILAHLRRSHLYPAFTALLNSLPAAVSSSFEHPLLSQLHTALVVHGDCAGSEDLFEKCVEKRLLKEQNRPWKARWNRLLSTAAPSPRAGHQLVKLGRTLYLYGGFSGTEELGDLWSWELPRQGDSVKTIQKSPWRLIEGSEDESVVVDKVGTMRVRPRSRSCHQLAVDESTGWIYLLGGYRAPLSVLPDNRAVNPNSRPIYTYNPVNDQDTPMITEPSSILGSLISTSDFPDQMSAPLAPTPITNHEEARGINYDDDKEYASDFWRFKPARGGSKPVWEVLSSDTSLEFGPALLSDHQMCIDSASQTLFVFGGRINEPTAPAGVKQIKRYSGFYTYNLQTSTWRSEFSDPLAILSAGLSSRVGHSMTFDPTSRLLHITGGERDGEICSDYWTIGPMPLSSSSSTKINHLTLANKVEGSKPPSVFTQRVNLDAAKRVWTSWSGFTDSPVATFALSSNPTSTKESSVAPSRAGAGGVEHAIWRGTTVPLQTLSATSQHAVRWHSVDPPRAGEAVPIPRFASPLVYDVLNETCYIFGGNPGELEGGLGESRLNDFWSLNIDPPASGEALRKAKFLIRKQKFDEMCQSPTVTALDSLVYLQTHLSTVVDHLNETESHRFRSSMASLLSAPPTHQLHDQDDSDSDDASMRGGIAGARQRFDAGMRGDSGRAGGYGEESKGMSEDVKREKRSKVFSELMGFFDTSFREPSKLLIDLV